MSSTRLQLLTRKADLFGALDLLEQDHQEGMIDDNAYHTARYRYEREAASVLEELDRFSTGVVARDASPPGARHKRLFLVAGAGMLVVGAMAIALVSALHPRSQTGTVTGDVGQAVSTPVPAAGARIAAAEQAARQHPKDVSALVILGNVYLDSGKAAAADRAYQRAMRLAPEDPQPPTLHAMVTGFAGRFGQAVAMLHGVERAHPRFARAWLLDGLFTANGLHRYAQGIAAWQHFLAINPHGQLVPQVHRWITAARKSEAAKR